MLRLYGGTGPRLDFDGQYFPRRDAVDVYDDHYQGIRRSGAPQPEVHVAGVRGAGGRRPVRRSVDGDAVDAFRAAGGRTRRDRRTAFQTDLFLDSVVRRGDLSDSYVPEKNTEIPESGNAAGDLAGPLPDYGRAGDLRRIFVCARGVHHGVDPSRDGTGREHREGHRSGQGPVRGGLLRVGRDAGRAGDAGAIHRADRFFDGGRDRRTDILRDARFPRVGAESENRVAVVVLAGADRRVRLYHRVARTVDGGYQFVPLSGRGGRVGRDHIYHAVYHPAQRSCLSPDQPVDSEADESAAGPVQRRVANRQQRAGVDVAAEKVAVEHVYLLRAVGRRGVDLFELLFAVRRGAFRRIRRQTDRYDDDHSLYDAAVVGACGAAPESQAVRAAVERSPFQPRVVGVVDRAADSPRADVRTDRSRSPEFVPLGGVDGVRHSAVAVGAVLETDQKRIPAFRTAFLYQPERKRCEHRRDDRELPRQVPAYG